MATDAAEPGSCEVEAWGEKAGSRRARVLAPACGIGAGIAVNGVGARWWLVKDALGLDLSASRQAQSGSPRQWTLGLGWYGIGL